MISSQIGKKVNKRTNKQETLCVYTRTIVSNLVVDPLPYSQATSESTTSLSLVQPSLDKFSVLCLHVYTLTHIPNWNPNALTDTVEKTCCHRVFSQASAGRKHLGGLQPLSWKMPPCQMEGSPNDKSPTNHAFRFCLWNTTTSLFDSDQQDLFWSFWYCTIRFWGKSCYEYCDCRQRCLALVDCCPNTCCLAYKYIYCIYD